MENDNSSASRAEDDLHLLLECLQFQKNCVSSQCQALTTLATMCSNSSAIRDQFRCSGGMKYVLELLYSTPSSQIQQTTLYTLGCAAEMNVVNQLKLCDAKLFTFLAELLKTSSTTLQTNDSTACSTNPALIATTAYLAGCLMCSNSQGQNLARERRVLHKLAGQFKSHLPAPTSLQESSHSVKQQQDNGHYSLEVWTSVCSALCSATNNPQNEVNQSLCSQLLPAALSVLNHVPLKTDTLRPVVTLIASCVSNNASTQNRLRLIGGLQILVTTLKQLMLPPMEVPTRNCPAELSVHLVRTLSAAMLGNVDNTHLVSTLEVIPVLLHLLQSSKRSDDVTEDSATINIVMCLGMLTEERPIAQQQLVSHGGVQLLLSAMAESGDGELNKAITFVLQQCLQQPDAAQKDDQNLCDEIARVEGLLAEEDQDMSPFRQLNESQQNKFELSLTAADLLKQSSATAALQILDSQKLPVIDRVSTWLANNETCQNKQDGEKNILEELHQYMTRVSGVPVLKNKATVDPSQAENVKLVQQPQNELETRNKSAEITFKESRLREQCTGSEKDTKNSAAKQNDRENVKRKLQPAKDVDKKRINIQTSKDVSNKTSVSHHKDNKLPDEADQLSSGKSLCENLQAELAKERARRLKLEKELHKLEQTGHQMKKKEDRHSKKDKPLKQDTSGNQPSKQADGQPQSHITKSVVASKLKHCKESCKTFPTQADTTPLSKQSNIRYAASANVHQSHCLKTMVLKSLQGCKHQSKTPGPNHGLSTLREKNGQTTKACVHTCKDHRDHHVSSQLVAKKKNSDHCNKENQPKPTTSVHKHYTMDASTNASTVSRQNLLPKTHSLVRDQTASVEFQQPLSHHRVPSSRSQFSCDHQCLGCKPRLKCPLITSRNFTTLLRMDRFTCPYHKRLVHRLIGHGEKELSVSCDHHVTTGESSGCSMYKDEHTHVHQARRIAVMENDKTDIVTVRSSRVPPNTHSVHQPDTCSSIAEVHVSQPNNETLVELSPSLSDSSSSLMTSKSVSCSNTSPEVGYSHEHDPDWSPAALSESNDSSCEIVSVKPGVCKTGEGRVNEVHCKTESVSTAPSSDEEYVPHFKMEVRDIQHSKIHRHKDNSGDSKTNGARVFGVGDHSTATHRLNLAVLKKSTATLSTHDDQPTETVYQLTAQPHRRKIAPVKLRSLPQRNALKNISNHWQRCSAREQRHSLSVFDYETPQKVPNKYDHAKIKHPVTDRENKPSFKQQRVLWSKSEEENLICGVNKMGRRWKHILNAYTFQPCRTPVHLKDKYRNIIGRH